MKCSIVKVNFATCSHHNADGHAFSFPLLCAQCSILCGKRRRNKRWDARMIGILTQRTGTENDCISGGTEQAHNHFILSIVAADWPSTGLARCIVGDDAIERLYEVGDDIWAFSLPMR